MSRFEVMWDRFWTNLNEAPGASPWDVDPTYVAQAHLDLFGSVLDPDRPVIDVGCGDGAQTAGIARRFDRVIGVDASPQALERARKHHGGPGLQYEQLDLLHPEQAAALHDRIGDAGLYVRTVLHAFTPEELELATASLAHLVGATGGAFFYELAPASRAFIQDLLQRPGPEYDKFRFVFARAPLPAEREDGTLERALTAAGFEVLTSGPIDYQGTVFVEGRRVNVPCFYVVARAGGAK